MGNSSGPPLSRPGQRCRARLQPRSYKYSKQCAKVTWRNEETENRCDLEEMETQTIKMLNLVLLEAFFSLSDALILY